VNPIETINVRGRFAMIFHTTDNEFVVNTLGRKLAIHCERDVTVELNLALLVVAILLRIILAVDARAIHHATSSGQNPGARRRRWGRRSEGIRVDPVHGRVHAIIDSDPDASVAPGCGTV